MKQLAFNFDTPPHHQEFSGPWGFVRSANGKFFRLCRTVINPASFNSLAPASWSAAYLE